MSKKIFWDLLTIMMAAVLCVSNISCSSDSDGDSGGGSSWTSKSNVLVGTWENTYGNYEDSRNYYEYRTIYTFNANNTGKHQDILQVWIMARAIMKPTKMILFIPLLVTVV